MLTLLCKDSFETIKKHNKETGKKWKKFNVLSNFHQQLKAAINLRLFQRKKTSETKKLKFLDLISFRKIFSVLFGFLLTFKVASALCMKTYVFKKLAVFEASKQL